MRIAPWIFNYRPHGSASAIFLLIYPYFYSYVYPCRLILTLSSTTTSTFTPTTPQVWARSPLQQDGREGWVKIPNVECMSFLSQITSKNPYIKTKIFFSMIQKKKNKSNIDLIYFGHIQAHT